METYTWPPAATRTRPLTSAPSNEPTAGTAPAWRHRRCLDLDRLGASPTTWSRSVPLPA